jgi:hypothetical protein
VQLELVVEVAFLDVQAAVRARVVLEQQHAVETWRKTPPFERLMPHHIE